LIGSVPAKAARKKLRQRRIRDQFFSADLLADPAWDMLIDLDSARRPPHLHRAAKTRVMRSRAILKCWRNSDGLPAMTRCGRGALPHSWQHFGGA
jgi:hypothetical protein